MAAVIGPLELEDLRYVYDTLRTLAYDMCTKITDPAADCERNMPNLRSTWPPSLVSTST
jgi:hypothetical protein